MDADNNMPTGWHVEEIEEANQILIYAEDGSLVAEVNRDYKEDEEIAAVAALITAAPDMLAALQSYDAVDVAHDALSSLIEIPEYSPQEIHTAAVNLLLALNACHEQRKAAITIATTLT